MAFWTRLALPRWYVYVLGILFACYVAGWGYTIHMAAVERSAGETFITPVGEHDSTSYANLAKSLALGSFMRSPGEYEYFHTPGYPAFVAAVQSVSGGSYFVVTFIQIVMVFAVALMTVSLVRTFTSEPVALGGSLLFLVNPLVPVLTLSVITDVLFLFLLMLGFLSEVKLMRTRPVLAILFAALCFGAAIYVRPAGFLAFPLFVVPIIVQSLSWRQKLTSALVLVCILSALLVPWMYRNKVHSGVFSFTSLVAFNMAYYSLPHFWLATTGLPLEQGIAKVEVESGVPRGRDAFGYPANWYNIASSPALMEYEIKAVLEAPFSYISWHLYNSLGFFINPAIHAEASTKNLKLLLARGEFMEVWRAATTPWWLFVERIAILAGLCLVGVGVWSLRRQPLVWAFVFIILYLAALGGPSSHARYRLPVEPFLSTFIVAGGLYVVALVRSRFSGKL